MATLIISIISLILLLAILVLLMRPKENSDTSSFKEGIDRFDKKLSDEMVQNRQEYTKTAKQEREEIGANFKALGDSISARMTEIATLQNTQFDSFSQQLNVLTKSNEEKLDKMRGTLEEKIKFLQEDNGKKLEQMRQTVDEKLHATLERRLGESFKMVSERLDLVHKGLGEMQTLASGVGDLKKVLSNVKTRGVWGEVQLGSLLEQILTPEQYEKNVATKPKSNDRVEFAIKLPGPEESKKPVWLPIDAKFPQEDYQRVVEAYEKADPELAEEAAKQLDIRIKGEAKDIRDKYIDPPHTTDFGIMFLPYESLYAEVARRTGLCEFIQREYRVIVTSPLTLGALLNSLQMGFRTLAIQKRSSEVWMLLSAVKTEFGKFGDILEKTQKKLQEASTTIEDAAKKSRTIESKLRKVQELPQAQEAMLLETLNAVNDIKIVE